MLVLVLVVVVSSFPEATLAVAAHILLAGLRSMVVVGWDVTTGKSVEIDMVVICPSGTVNVGSSDECTMTSAG